MYVPSCDTFYSWFGNARVANPKYWLFPTVYSILTPRLHKKLYIFQCGDRNGNQAFAKCHRRRGGGGQIYTLITQMHLTDLFPI